ncbi:guanosine-3',5'-bis(diphosphate) 3'-pyrophosphohydrolase [Acinetobacter pittii]|nr:guanosine-3',5'-bis(diphosphate) 3'-pyrophosphohydrolase [Acinetobacter pittii]MBK1418452.1 guanosine-3',5'-bis(diphosphate) 3'-pyrophosphohydrolase [Acinetobacter pittii]
MGQIDKAGQPYIQHPLRVMQNAQHPDAKIVAVLHDILEDTATSVTDLRSLGFDEEIIHAVLAVTKQDGESRFQAVQRTVKNPIACEVKLADLSDNMDLSRLPKISTKDLIRYKQYQKVQKILKEAYAIHQHINTLDLDSEYPEFEYGCMQFNFQYLLNALFDKLHPMGGNQIGSPQEWWILFEDASEYFAYCKRKKLIPSPKHFIQLVNSTDRDFFGSSFQTLEDQDLLIEIYNNVLGHHFKKDVA